MSKKTIESSQRSLAQMTDSSNDPVPAPITILIAGASGYIGKAILPRLLEKFPNAKIIALSRSQQQSTDARIVWKSCDLFSTKSIIEAISEPVNLAFYLVHSMGPTAQLDQGSFADYDLILADNFAHAIKNAKVHQLIYLGGLIPYGTDLSLHLQSRLEVEETFHQFQLPTTIFRAGLILGEAGSSFQILLKLVKRLPIMVCPAWTQTLTTPVDLATVLNAMTSAALRDEHIGKTYDLAGCQPLTYLHMMRETARRLGLKRYFLTVPFFTPTLSRLWVTLITNSPKALVYPLVESLKHQMVARPSHQYYSDWQRENYYNLLNNTTMKANVSGDHFRFRIRRKTVRSVQRLSLPSQKNALFVRDEYISWLPRHMRPLIQVQKNPTNIELKIFWGGLTLLQLTPSTEHGDEDRQILYITGGLLVAKNNHGRLEFRVVLDRRFVLAAIHDYRPALPWFIYKYTQAVLHLLIMRSFSRHLSSNADCSSP